MKRQQDHVQYSSFVEFSFWLPASPVARQGKISQAQTDRPHAAAATVSGSLAGSSQSSSIAVSGGDANRQVTMPYACVRPPFRHCRKLVHVIHYSTCIAWHGMGFVFTESQAACVPELTHFHTASHVSQAFPSSPLHYSSSRYACWMGRVGGNGEAYDSEFSEEVAWFVQSLHSW
jgi:hypothetical protein